MGEAMAQALAASLGRGRLLVANRTLRRAEALAARCGGQAIAWSDLDAGVADADVVLAGTGATEVLIEADQLKATMAGRPDRSLLVIDIAVPRNIDPAAAAVDGVRLLDMDDLAAFAEAGMASRRLELPAAERIVAAEVDRYGDLSSERHVAPLVAALRQRSEAIRTAELERHRRRLGHLDESQQRAVESLTRAIVAKVLHDPTVALKAGAGTPKGEQLASALRQLFDL